VSVSKFLAESTEAGFTMVDAFFKMRTNPRGHEHPVVRFTFAPEEDVYEGDAMYRKYAIKAFTQIGEEALWGASGHLNHYFHSGNMVNGLYSISINLGARNPMVDGNGNKLLQWARDETGRVGDKPIPIEPKLFLRIFEGNVCVV
jgi:hypothetical protein